MNHRSKTARGRFCLCLTPRPHSDRASLSLDYFRSRAVELSALIEGA